MKKLIRNIARKALGSDVIWKLMRPVVRAADFLRYQREFPAIKDAEASRLRQNNELSRMLGEPVVKHGPFAGMRYPSFTSYGSAMFPKIIGCYEREISGIIEQCCNKPYEQIIDVGCAEGYYAVGFAMRNSTSQVYAYDTDEAAQKYCHELAQLNGVEQRITIRASCTSRELGKFPFGKRAFILCDCEGYEKQLFTPENLSNLKHCDLLIETHDFIDMTISSYLEDLFRNTHRTTRISSLGDIQKAKTYVYPETSGLDIHTRYKLVREGRPDTMEWYFFESKQSS